MTWPGWEHFSPSQIGRSQGKRPKYGAEHCLVTDDLTLFTRREIEALAEQQAIPIQVIVATKARGPVEKAQKLADIAALLGLHGLVFDSRREARRWKDLRTREGLGLISNLRRQVRFDLHKAGVVVGCYVADFTYIEDSVPIVEDAKGHRTREYLRKRKLFQREYQIAIRET